MIWAALDFDTRLSVAFDARHNVFEFYASLNGGDLTPAEALALAAFILEHYASNLCTGPDAEDAETPTVGTKVGTVR